MPSPRDVIEDIRKSKYGVGLPPGSPQRMGFDALRPDLDRAIRHLSDDLYSEDVHFVLELVQNADDNPYRPGEFAFIRLVRTRETLLVQNNETGFEEANVRALCSIGPSTKRKAAGHIGEKGIGFKSVFRVSDEPHIVSNGYSFRFRRRDPETRLGFVVPEWVDNLPAFIDQSVTNIVLPLRSGLSDEIFHGEWFGPTLLLFLNRLKSIEYADHVQGTGWCYCRVDVDQVVELHSGPDVQRWRLVRSSANVPATLREEKREGLTQSDVVLAFPLDDEGAADGSQEREAHAFLPVRCYGFRFVVHGDFILTSSREDIVNCPWNVWLRDQVAPLFVTAIESFKKAQDGLTMTFLSFVPEQKPIGVFSTVSDSILASLLTMDCILTASGHWAKPEQVVAASAQLQAVISNADVHHILGREYIATNFKVPTSLLKSLGVLVFRMPELLRCLHEGEWLRSKPDKWFALLFAHLSTLDLKQEIDKLKMLQIVPMEDGTLTSVSGCKGRVFLPLPKESNYGFEDKVPLVRKAIFDGVEQETKSAAWKFLRSLGVKKADPSELITEYILPLFESKEAGDSWRAMTDGFCIGSVEFIKDHVKEFTEAGNDISRLTKDLYIKFVHSENRSYTKPDRLYLGKHYGNMSGIEKLLDGFGECCFVDPVYLERGLERLAKRWKKPVVSESIQRKRNREVKGWRTFFIQIGLTETIRVVRQPTDTEPAQANSPDLESLFRTGDRSRIEKTVKLLDENWSYYRSYLSTDAKRWEGRRLVHAGRQRTKLGELLAGTCWLTDKDGKPRRPSELFLDIPLTREILGSDVPYLATEFQDQRMVEDLGIQKGPTVEAALARLRGFAGRSMADIDVVRTLYHFLDQQFDSQSSAIVIAFSTNPLCLTSGSADRFLPSGQVFWQDPGPAFLSRRGFLSRQWADLKPFFVNKLGVALSPSPEDYAAMLCDLSKEDLVPQEERAVWEIYRELDRFLAGSSDAEDVTDQRWWKLLVQGAVFWTDKREFWRNEGDLFVNDHDQFHSIFKDQPKIAFLNIPTNQHPQVSRFLKAASIPLLSEVVSVGHIDPTCVHDHPHLAARCQSVVPYALRYLFFRENDIYRELEESGDIAKLSGLSVRICDELEIEATLGGESTRVRQSFSSRLPQIFVAREAAEDLDGLAIELARMLGHSEGMGMFVVAVMAKVDAATIERFMRAKGIPELPCEEDVKRVFVVSAEFNYEAMAPENLVAEVRDKLLNDAETVPAPTPTTGGQSDVHLLSNEHAYQPHDTVPAAVPPLPAGTRTGRGSPLGEVEDETHAKGKETKPETGEPSGYQPGSTDSRQPALPPIPGHFTAVARDRETSHRADGWVPLVPPAQANVNVRDGTPTVRNRRFGERPASGRAEPPGHGENDETICNHKLQSHAIGHWGEGYAFVALEAELSSRHPGAEVVRSDASVRFVVDGELVAEAQWLNWQEDRGIGYDVVVREGEQEDYVEVKATADEVKTCFEVTAAQWDCARLHGQRYRIFRVYNAGHCDARIDVLCDPYKLWVEGRLVARPLRIEL